MRTNTKRLVVCILLVVFGLLFNGFGYLLFDVLGLHYVIDYQSLFPAAGYIIAFSGVIFFLFPGITEALSKINPPTQATSLQKEVNEIIKQRLKDEPGEVPVWVLMQTKLEGYFDRNLSQISYIFWLSVVVMGVGFAFILFGISHAFSNPSTSSNITPAIVGSVAGIITEFIGATFLFIYRSTIR